MILEESQDTDSKLHIEIREDAKRARRKKGECNKNSKISNLQQLIDQFTQSIQSSSPSVQEQTSAVEQISNAINSINDQSDFNEVFSNEIVETFLELFLTLSTHDMRLHYVSMIMSDIVYFSRNKGIFIQERFTDRINELQHTTSEVVRQNCDFIFSYLICYDEWHCRFDENITFSLWNSISDYGVKLSTFPFFPADFLDQRLLYHLIEIGVDLVGNVTCGINYSDIGCAYYGISNYLKHLSIKTINDNLPSIHSLFSDEFLLQTEQYCCAPKCAIFCFVMYKTLMEKGICYEKIRSNLPTLINQTMVGASDDSVLQETLTFFSNIVYNRYLEFNTDFFVNLCGLVTTASFGVRKAALKLFSEALNVDLRFIDKCETEFIEFVFDMGLSNDIFVVDQVITAVLLLIEDSKTSYATQGFFDEYANKEDFLEALHEQSTNSNIPVEMQNNADDLLFKLENQMDRGKNYDSFDEY